MSAIVNGFWYTITMQVTVKLFASFREHGLKLQQVEIPDGSTVRDIVRMFSLSEDEPMIKLVNGSHAEFDTNLHNSDIVALFPPVAGG